MVGLWVYGYEKLNLAVSVRRCLHGLHVAAHVRISIPKQCIPGGTAKELKLPNDSCNKQTLQSHKVEDYSGTNQTTCCFRGEHKLF